MCADDGGGDWRRRCRPSRRRDSSLAVEVAVGYIACQARQKRHTRRSSRTRMRISSPLRARHHCFPPPPRTTGTRTLLRRRRLLDRSIARTRCDVGGGGGGQLHRVSRASRSRACTPSQRIARVITAPLPRCHPCARAAAAAKLFRLLACSRARRRRWWGWGRRSVTSRVTRVKHADRVARHARARAYHHRFARFITVFRTPARATGTCVLLRRRRSLVRSIVRTRCGVGGGGGVQFHRASRACARERHHRASRASSPFLFPPRTHTRALRRRRRSLAR